MSTTISGTNGVTFPDSTSMQTGQQACKAWVNFNGQGTVAIRDAYNVSSITDNGVGRYYVNFATAMADANYSFISTCSGDAYVQYVQTVNTTTLAYFAVNNTSNSGFDSNGICVAIFS